MEAIRYESALKAIAENGDYIDISEYLADIIKAKKINIALSFITASPKKMCLFSLCYREALLPTFAILLWKGYIVMVHSSSANGYELLESDLSYCDHIEHNLLLQWDGVVVKIYVDNILVMQKPSHTLFEYRYINSVFIGKCFYADDDLLYFDGVIKNVKICCDSKSNDYVEEQEGNNKNESVANVQRIFYHMENGCCNYRIPAIIKTKKGNLIATADARMDCPGDNPNHIARAVRISKDAGASWSDIKIFHDYGGQGRRTGASSIDALMVQDQDTQRIFMLYSHTSQLVGSYNSVAGIGFYENDKKLVFDKNEQKFIVEKDGTIVDMNGIKTGYISKKDGVYKGHKNMGSLQHGSCIFHQMNTTFLKLCYSDDEGETWSTAVDLNPMVKEPWMRFIGSCPGQGIQIHNGAYKGRLLLPIYFANEYHMSSFAVLYSDDHGASWHRGSSVHDNQMVDGAPCYSKTMENERYMTSETSLIELKDGSIKAYMRNYCGQPNVCSALSIDGGIHFHDVAIETQLLDPNCQNSSLRVPYKGNILYFFCNPSDIKIRRNGILKVSFDNATTWIEVARVACGDFGYSCLCMCDEETIGVLYEGKDVSIYFKKYKIADLLQNVT